MLNHRIYVKFFCNISNKLSRDPRVESKHYQNPDLCDLSELLVVENVVSGRKDIVTLFQALGKQTWR